MLESIAVHFSSLNVPKNKQNFTSTFVFLDKDFCTIFFCLLELHYIHKYWYQPCVGFIFFSPVM